VIFFDIVISLIYRNASLRGKWTRTDSLPSRAQMLQNPSTFTPRKVSSPPGLMGTLGYGTHGRNATRYCRPSSKNYVALKLHFKRLNLRSRFVSLILHRIASKPSLVKSVRTGSSVLTIVSRFLFDLIWFRTSS